MIEKLSSVKKEEGLYVFDKMHDKINELVEAFNSLPQTEAGIKCGAAIGHSYQGGINRCLNDYPCKEHQQTERPQGEIMYHCRKHNVAYTGPCPQCFPKAQEKLDFDS